MIIATLHSVVLLIACSAMFGNSSSLLTRKAHFPLAGHRAEMRTQAAKYRIFCVNGKIEIDTRDINEMKAARGDQVCELDSFGSLTEARIASKRRGGVGAPCACK